MVEFGDELIIESFNVPWLIWVQLVVMILLVIILFSGFSLFSSDAPSTSSLASPSAASVVAARPVRVNSSTSSNALIKVEDQSLRRDVGSSELLRREVEDNGEDSPFKDSSMIVRIFRFPGHPCNYLGQAKKALFKCFGLDVSSEKSTNHRREKQE